MRATFAVSLAALLVLSAERGAGVPARPLKTKPVNLLVNGSFEEGADPGKYQPLDKGSTAIKGWTVTRGQIDYIGTYWPAADGKRSIDLHGSPGFGGIEQTLSTLKGQRYRVTFALAGTPGAGKKQVAVRAADRKGTFQCDGGTMPLAEIRWAMHSWDFVATAAKTTLEIHTLETTDPLRGPGLDNVAVVAVER